MSMSTECGEHTDVTPQIIFPFQHTGACKNGCNTAKDADLRWNRYVK